MEEDDTIIIQVIFKLEDGRLYNFDVDYSTTFYETKKILSNAAHILKNSFTIYHEGQEYSTEYDNQPLQKIFPTLKKIEFYLKLKKNQEEQDENEHDQISVKYNIKEPCKEHIGKFLVLYCISCKKSICNECFSISHNSHEVEEKADYLMPAKILMERIFANSFMFKSDSKLSNYLQCVSFRSIIKTDVFDRLRQLINELENKCINCLEFFSFNEDSTEKNNDLNLELLKKYCTSSFIKLKNNIETKEILINDEVFLSLYNKLKAIKDYEMSLFTENANKYKTLNQFYVPFTQEIKNMSIDLNNILTRYINKDIYAKFKEDISKNVVDVVQKEDVIRFMFENVNVPKSSLIRVEDNYNKNSHTPNVNQRILPSILLFNDSRNNNNISNNNNNNFTNLSNNNNFSNINNLNNTNNFTNLNSLNNNNYINLNNLNNNNFNNFNNINTLNNLNNLNSVNNLKNVNNVNNMNNLNNNTLSNTIFNSISKNTSNATNSLFSNKLNNQIQSSVNYQTIQQTFTISNPHHFSNAKTNINTNMNNVNMNVPNSTNMNNTNMSNINMNLPNNNNININNMNMNLSNSNNSTNMNINLSKSNEINKASISNMNNMKNINNMNISNGNNIANISNNNMANINNMNTMNNINSINNMKSINNIISNNSSIKNNNNIGNNISDMNNNISNMNNNITNMNNNVSKINNNMSNFTFVQNVSECTHETIITKEEKEKGKIEKNEKMEVESSGETPPTQNSPNTKNTEMNYTQTKIEEIKANLTDKNNNNLYTSPISKKTLISVHLSPSKKDENFDNKSETLPNIYIQHNNYTLKNDSKDKNNLEMPTIKNNIESSQVQTKTQTQTQTTTFRNSINNASIFGGKLVDVLKNEKNNTNNICGEINNEKKEDNNITLESPNFSKKIISNINTNVNSSSNINLNEKYYSQKIENTQLNYNLILPSKNLSITFMYPVYKTNILKGAIDKNTVQEIKMDFSEFSTEDPKISEFPNGGAYCNYENYLYFTGGQEYIKEAGKLFLSIPKNNPNQNAKKLPLMKNNHWNHSMIADKDKIYVIGGYNSNKCEYYDITNKIWKEMPDLTANERQRSMLFVDKNFLYCFMGLSQNGILDSVERINLENIDAGWENIIVDNCDDINLKFYGAGIIRKNQSNKIYFIGGKKENKKKRKCI